MAYLEHRAYVFWFRVRPILMDTPFQETKEGAEMTVSFLITSLLAGGAERQLTELACALARHGHAVYVNTFYSGEVFRQKLIEAGVQVHCLHRAGRFDFFRVFLRLRRAIRAQSPQVIYSFMHTANIFSAVLKFSLIRACFVWGIRSSTIVRSRVTWLSCAMQQIAASLSGMADQIIFNSQAGLTFHCEYFRYPKEKSHVVPNGIDTIYFAPTSMKRDPNGPMIFGLVSRLHPLKDIECFLDAVRDVLKDLSVSKRSFSFKIIGDGPDPYRRTLKKKATQLGLDPYLDWVGHLSNINQTYPQLDCFVSSSLTEGFSNSIAEAMASEVPCIVTAVGDSALIVGQTGWVVPPGDPKALATAMKACINLSQVERDHRAVQARERIQTAFNLEQIFHKSLAVFKKDPVTAKDVSLS